LNVLLVSVLEFEVVEQIVIVLKLFSLVLIVILSSVMNLCSYLYWLLSLMNVFVWDFSFVAFVRCYCIRGTSCPLVTLSYLVLCVHLVHFWSLLINWTNL
jgi:hypothetical protein